MQSTAFENEFLKNLKKLTREQQNRALAYIKLLLRRDQKQQELLQFAGSLDARSIREMSEAIEAENDIWIAASAQQHQLTLVTRDKHPQ